MCLLSAGANLRAAHFSCDDHERTDGTVKLVTVLSNLSGEGPQEGAGTEMLCCVFVKVGAGGGGDPQQKSTR